MSLCQNVELLYCSLTETDRNVAMLLYSNLSNVASVETYSLINQHTL